MAKCNSRHTPTTREPLEQRKRTPHRSGQEYEFGETPETGLGGAGAGADPDAQCARMSNDSDGNTEEAVDPSKETRQGGGDEESEGFGNRHARQGSGRDQRQTSQHGRGDHNDAR